MITGLSKKLARALGREPKVIAFLFSSPDIAVRLGLYKGFWLEHKELLVKFLDKDGLDCCEAMIDNDSIYDQMHNKELCQFFYSVLLGYVDHWDLESDYERRSMLRNWYEVRADRLHAKAPDIFPDSDHLLSDEI